ncbi:uncharacterized protein LOC118478409 [Aplysia californica]|uniref:Uncharacterized protein LOC118478409 n=1 Tax=Aplysia californica TaxID=6500 RepID=A0ABM1VZK6_APLCA|nr:uncharacterized protein LOC118478409 [Aplysia californica]
MQKDFIGTSSSPGPAVDRRTSWRGTHRQEHLQEDLPRTGGPVGEAAPTGRSIYRRTSCGQEDQSEEHTDRSIYRRTSHRQEDQLEEHPQTGASTGGICLGNMSWNIICRFIIEVKLEKYLLGVLFYIKVRVLFLQLGEKGKY